jgi:hypothetical protein
MSARLPGAGAAGGGRLTLQPGPGGPLLDHVGQFMGQQFLTGAGVGRILAGGEDNVVAGSVGLGIEALGPPGRRAIRMNPDLAEVVAEPGPEKSTYGTCQAMAGARWEDWGRSLEGGWLWNRRRRLFLQGWRDHLLLALGYGRWLGRRVQVQDPFGEVVGLALSRFSRLRGS